MNTMNEFDLQFKIFTLVDTTKSYVILNESMNKLLSVNESIVLMGYAIYESSFNDPMVKHVCIYFEIAYAKNCKKTNIQRSSNDTNFFTVINENSRFNGYFNSDFDNFLQLHSLTLYE